MSREDEHRLVEKELSLLKAPAKTKGRTERLAQIAEEARRPHGTYHTRLETWTCSCPSYLISRFLLCKHLVRLANAALKPKVDPCTSLLFFYHLRCNHYTPFYSIPGIHYNEESADEAESVEINRLGYNDVARSHGPKTLPSHLKDCEKPSEHTTEVETTEKVTQTTSDGGNEDERTGEWEWEDCTWLGFDILM